MYRAHVACLSLLLGGSAAFGATPAPEGLSGLVEVSSRRMDSAWLLPGADFRAYGKVLIDAPEVAFRKDWMREMNRVPYDRRITEQDAMEIANAARSGFSDVWAQSFTKAGFQVVSEPGPDVLRLTPQITDLYINAPDPMSAALSRSYTVEAGEAVLALRVRDSLTGATLGYASDRRATRDNMQLTWTTSVSNLADFEDLFRQWGRIAADGLKDLAEKSPLAPEPRDSRK